MREASAGLVYPAIPPVIPATYCEFDYEAPPMPIWFRPEEAISPIEDVPSFC